MGQSPTEKMRIQCPHCQKALMVPASASGKAARCPGCGQTFSIPEVFQLEATPAQDSSSQSPFNSPYSTPTSNISGADPLFGDLRAFEQSAPTLPTGPFNTGQGLPAATPYGETPEGASGMGIVVKSRAERIAQEQAAKSNDGGYFDLEQKGIDKGIVGGLIMMLIAVVWFVGGMMAGLFFWYTPILFLFGLYGFIKGVATGNITGRRR